MFGYLPKYVDGSLFNMIVYNVFPVEAKFDANGPLVGILTMTIPYPMFAFILVPILTKLDAHIFYRYPHGVMYGII